MEDFEQIIQKFGWFYNTGPENDVVISSRIRLARNLSNFAFPPHLGAEEEKIIQTQVITAFRNLPDTQKFGILYLENLNQLEREMLLERNVVSGSYSKQKDRAITYSDDGEITGLINEEDHLRLCCIKGGLSLKEAFHRVNELDSLLENTINYAVSMERGYLSSSLNSAGTGLKASVLIHIPALSMASLMDEAFKIINEKGFTVKGFGVDNKNSHGNIYQISNYFSIGYDEATIIDNLHDLVYPLVELERKTRDALMEQKKIELEDKIYRALGVLKYARSISSMEAVKLISLVRLGVCMKIVEDYTIEKVTMLFFISQKSHIRKALEGLELNNDHQIADYVRAQIIRDTL